MEVEGKSPAFRQEPQTEEVRKPRGRNDEQLVG